MTIRVNPFALVRASDYTDEQINSLWVELGSKTIDEIIEPRSRVSKFILGGKGTGKTHLLRYYSYQVSRLRSPKETGLSLLFKQKFLAIFIRATGVDATRFEATSEVSSKWQHLFGIYLELKLVEGVLDALCDIKNSSDSDLFDDKAFISELAASVTGQSILQCKSINDFRKWLIQERRRIDDAVNNAAFTGVLNLHIPFSIGALCLPVSRAIGKWHASLVELPLIYMIDEIENFTSSQQQVLNSLIRYGEGLATFRVTGRLYSRKTFATLADGEENREGSEFKTIILDSILRDYSDYPKFAKKFVTKRLGSEFNPSSCFEEISPIDFYSSAIDRLNLDKVDDKFKSYIDAFKPIINQSQSADELVDILTKDVPLLLQKLNLLLFCKKFKKKLLPIDLAKEINSDSIAFLNGHIEKKKYYANAYGHYALDLFAQLCRESNSNGDVPYAGFDTFVKMSSGNPRNLLIILGRIYGIASFKEIDFITNSKLSISIQTDAAMEAARFMFEMDTNYDSKSELARTATMRLAEVFRTARYAINIPEVSPLAVSFSDEDLTIDAKKVLNSALNYSFIFDISSGRPDRNSQRLNKKIQLNPILSPRWGLPISRRGDISLNRDLVNSIFDPNRQAEFKLLLKGLKTKWNNPFCNTQGKPQQTELF